MIKQTNKKLNQVLTQKLGRSKAALQETLLRLSRSNLQKAGQVGNIIFVFILVFVLVFF